VGLFLSILWCGQSSNQPKSDFTLTDNTWSTKNLTLLMLGSKDYTHFENLYFQVTALTPGLIVTRSPHLHYIPPCNKKSSSTLHSPLWGYGFGVYCLFLCNMWTVARPENLQYGNRRFEAFHEVCSLDLTLLSWKREVLPVGSTAGPLSKYMFGVHV
jgi:hypothetical protein